MTRAFFLVITGVSGFVNLVFWGALVKLFLISIILQFVVAVAIAEKKSESPDPVPQEESCPAYGCSDDATDDGSERGEDSVDGTDPGDDWWGGDRDGGSDNGDPDFTYTVQNNLITFVEFTCTVGGMAVEFSEMGHEPMQVEIDGETVVIHRRENSFAGENVMLMQRYDAAGRLTNSIYKTWPKNEPLRFTFETTSHGQKDICEVTITPRK